MNAVFNTLLKQLKSENDEQSERAADKLRAAALENADDFQTPKGVAALVELIDFPPNWNARQTVMFVLDRLAPTETVSILLEDLKNKNLKIRQQAVQKFAHITESMFPALIREIKRRAVPTLLDAAQNEDWFVSTSSIAVLGRIKSKQAVPVFIKSLDKKNGWVRDESAIALANLGAKAAAAVPRLIEALRAPTANAYAAQALGNIGAAAIEAVPALKQAAENGDDELAESAEEAVEKIIAADKRRARRLAKSSL